MHTIGSLVSLVCSCKVLASLGAAFALLVSDVPVYSTCVEGPYILLCINDGLCYQIAEEFDIPATQKLCLSVNGYAAPSQGPASLLRNNDIVTVASAFTHAKEVGWLFACCTSVFD